MSQVLTENMPSFVVKPLSEFKGVDAESGQYLCRKIEKGTGKESKGVMIAKPSLESFVSAMESNETIANAAYEWFVSQAEEVVKARVSDGATMIYTSDYSTDKIASYLQTEEVKQGKISKERIENWFKSEVSGVLSRAFQEKLGANLSNDKLLEILKMYQSAFCMFAKKEYSFNDSVYGNVEKALNLLPDSQMKAFCVNKLPNMKQGTADEWAL